MRFPALANQTTGRTKVVWAGFVFAIMVMVFAGGWPGGGDGNSPAFGQSQLPAGLPTGEHLIALALPQAQSPQGMAHQGIVIIDPVDRVLSVYQIDLQTHAIKLQSVRRIHWDLKMSEYNGQSPLPNEIQALVEQQ